MDKKFSLAQFFNILLTVFIAMYVIFTGQLILNMRADLQDIKDQLKHNSNGAAAKIISDPFETLDEKCVDCHTERKFMGEHSSSDLNMIISDMESHPDMKLTREDEEKVHASMTLLRCVNCHDSSVLGKFAELTPAQKRQTILDMREKPGSTIRRQDVEDIMRAYQRIQGY